MTPRIFVALPVLMALFAWPDPAVARRDASDWDVFATEANALIASALAEITEVPGLAMAVVVEDRVALARGWGVADIENDVPSTGETLYYIASATKPFTALAAARLHARGIIDLDSSLASHLEGSGMDLELVPAAVTLRDLLSHTAGLENGAMTTRLAYTGEHTPELLWRLLSATEPNEAGPGSFEYTNFGYNLLTLVLERELDQPWQDLLRDEVFAPAGLQRTTAYASLPVAEGWPVAAPYFGMHPEGMWRVPLVKVDATMHSAGGMLTTAEDAARWLLLQLNDGRIDGQQIFDPEVIHETHLSRVEPEDSGRRLFGTTGCGLGWLHGSYAGQEVLHHSGGYPGFRSLISFMPEAGVGVALFVNESSVGNPLAETLVAWAYDWWLESGTETGDEALARVVQMRDRFAERIEAGFAERAQREWALELDRAAYVGRYANSAYGLVEVQVEGESLEVRMGQLHCVAEPFSEPNSIRVELVPGQGEVMRFIVGEDGHVSAMEYDGARFARR